MKPMKIFQYVSLGVIAVAIVIMAYFFYMLFYPFKTVDLVEPVKVLTPEVKRGGDVKLKLEVVKYNNSQAE